MKWTIPVNFPKPHPHPGLISSLFPSGFSSRNFVRIFSCVPHVPSSSTVLHFIILTLFGEILKMLKLLICTFLLSPATSSFLVPRSKYSSQRPVLTHPQSAPCRYAERPRFTPIAKNRQRHIVHNKKTAGRMTAASFP